MYFFSYFLNMCDLVLISRNWWKTGSFPLKWVKILEHLLCFPYPSSLLIFCSFIKSFALLSTFRHLLSLSHCPCPVWDRVRLGQGGWLAGKLIRIPVFSTSSHAHWWLTGKNIGKVMDTKKKAKKKHEIWAESKPGIWIDFFFFAEGKPLSLGCLHSMKQNN